MPMSELIPPIRRLVNQTECTGWPEPATVHPQLGYSGSRMVGDPFDQSQDIRILANCAGARRIGNTKSGDERDFTSSRSPRERIAGTWASVEVILTVSVAEPGQQPRFVLVQHLELDFGWMRRFTLA